MMLCYFIFALDCNFYGLFDTSLEVFQGPQKKNIKKIEKKKKENHQIWIIFKPIYRP